MRGRTLVAAWGAVGLWAATTPAGAHVDYVTDEGDGAADGLSFFLEVLAEPANAALLATGVVCVLAVLAGYWLVRPARRDVAVLRETLAGYADLLPWMLRLSVGLPLVGAGFAGYLFSPAVAVPARQLQVALGFLLLFGLATRAVALVGLLVYLVTRAGDLRLLLAFEYVPGFLAIALLGSGRPSADHVLQRVASAEGTTYGLIDPIHRAAR